MRRTLTDKGVAALKPRLKRYTLPDPELGGMYIRVPPSGAKAYVAVAKAPGGRQVWTTIGPTDSIAIASPVSERGNSDRVRAGKSPIEARLTPSLTSLRTGCGAMSRQKGSGRRRRSSR